MPLVAMGELLREGRLKRNLTVEDVAAQLKISPRLIRDLEAGNEPSLPHAVYVRGFIKSYARLLDIDPEQLAPGLSVYEQAEQDITPSPAFTPPRPRSNRGIVILALICALAFAGYWYYHTYYAPARQGQSSGESLPTRSEPAPPAPAPHSAPAPAPRSAVSPRPGVDVPASASLAGSASVLSGSLSSSAPIFGSGLATGGAGGQPSTLAGTAPAMAASPESAPNRPLTSDETAGEEAPVRVSGFRPPGRELPVSGTGRGATVNLGLPPQDAAGARVNQLVLTGMAECWVHSTADENDTRQFSIQPGETFSLSFSKTLVVKLGNAGGVRLKFNGSELPAPGKDGQVKTLQFPEAGAG